MASYEVASNAPEVPPRQVTQVFLKLRLLSQKASNDVPSNGSICQAHFPPRYLHAFRNMISEINGIL
jgi:hypothetical protein